MTQNLRSLLKSGQINARRGTIVRIAERWTDFVLGRISTGMVILEEVGSNL